MGDRTFSGIDVIRIYEDFLTSDEQEEVENFFAEMVEPAEPLISFDELGALVGLIRQLFTPLRPLLTFVLNRFAFFIGAVSTVQFVLARLEIILDDLLARGVVDA